MNTQDKITIIPQNYNNNSFQETYSKEDVFFRRYALVITVLACISSSVGASLFSWILVAAFAVLIFRPSNLIGPLLLFTACDDFLLITEGVSFSRFCVLFFIAGVFLNMLVNRASIKRASFFPVALMLLGIILSLYSIYNYTSFPLVYALNLTLLIAMINHTPQHVEDIAKQLYRYSIIAIVYVAYILFSGGLDSLVEGERLTLTESTNSNQIAMGLAVVFVVLLSALLISSKKKLLTILLMLLTVFALFLTGSRSSLLAVLITSFLLFISFVTDKRARKKVVVLMLLCVAGGLLIYTYLEKNFPIIMDRFTIENVSQSGGTGRTEVWEAFFTDYFPNHFLIGIGFDPLNMYYAAYYSNGEGHGAHNILVEILSKTGIVGLGLYGAYFISFFRGVKKRLRTNRYVVYSLAIVMVVLINGIGENVLLTRFLWYGVGLFYIFSNGKKKSVVTCGEEENV